MMHDRRPRRMGASTRRILGIAADSVLVMAVVGVMLIAYGLLDNRWYKIVAIDGGSMAPALEAGDAVVLTRPPMNPKPGMVLTLQMDGGIVTHRVVASKPDGTLITQGDANSTWEEWAPGTARVVGRVRLRLPLLGRVLHLTVSVPGGRRALPVSAYGVTCENLRVAFEEGRIVKITGTSQEKIDADFELIAFPRSPGWGRGSFSGTRSGRPLHEMELVVPPPAVNSPPADVPQDSAV